MSANKLKQNYAIRQLQIDDVEEILSLATAAVDDASRHVRFRLRYEELEDIHEKFHNTHNSIISTISVLENPDLVSEKQIKSAFNDTYFTIKTIYNNLFPTISGDVSVKSSKVTPNVKLPKISLPSFSGNYKDWTTFHDIFTSLIHNNANLSDIEKFQYLLSSLKSQALSLLKGFPLTAQNYHIAFDTLTKRYQNKRLLANSYWQDITNISKLTNESVEGLRNLLDTFSENLSSLKNLGLPVDQWDFVLFHMIIQKLDNATIKRFELQECSSDIPSFRNLHNFLLNQCTALESAALSTSIKPKYSPLAQTQTKQQKPSSSKSTSTFLAQTNNISSKIKCNFCNSPHTIYKCYSFLSKTPTERLKIAQSNNWCINCLHSAHDISKCASKSSCRTCSRKHHSLLHIDSDENEKQTSPSSSDINSCNSAQSFTTTASSNVLLATAQVEILDAWGNYKTVRVLLDSGSQTNIITKKCVASLGLTLSKSFLCIKGIGERSSPSTSTATCTIRPREGIHPIFTFDAVVIPKICSDLPNFTTKFSFHDSLNLADPNFNKPGSVDILLGAEIFPSLLLDGRQEGGVGEPSALETVFGWVLMGRTHSSCKVVNSLHVTLDSSLNATLKAFWELEELPILASESHSPDEILCEEIFKKDISRDCKTGRFSVSLPFKQSIPVSFGDTYSLALRRFLLLEKRLNKDSSLRKQYNDFMKDYLESDHMTLVDSMPSDEFSYFIPHHCVLKPDSTSTKLRVVFDASAKVAGHSSLNDCLLTGQKLQKDIATILLRFRTHKFVFTADIRQMYRQILIHTNHRKYQRILWRFSPSESIKCYELNTVTYGLSSAPFLALRTLRQLAIDEKDSCPLASRILDEDIYIDDVVSGSDNVQNAIDLRNELISLLNKGGFELRKWASNEPEILEGIPIEHQLMQSFSFTDGEFMKILGLCWNPNIDTFSFVTSKIDSICTKRSILSQLARTYDPLGFLTPFTFFMKHLIQVLWTQGLQWDQTPTSDVVNCWNQCKFELSHLQNLRIPRCIFPESYTRCELHGFGDSSEKGYAAVVYFRFFYSSGQIETFLICAKSKVAPIKRISLPRLELCAALLLAKLISFVVSTYPSGIFSDLFAWSDSTVALSWIKSSPHKWKSFVSNRTTKIQNLVPPENWFHVKSEDNPADFGSRGLTPLKLINCSKWWSGPAWLRSNQILSTSFVDSEDSPLCSEEERKIVLITSVQASLTDDLITKFSSLPKIQRILAYVLRFCFNTRNSSSPCQGKLTFPELTQALLFLVKQVQADIFAVEIDQLRKGKLLSKPLRKLNPFLDSDDVLRVGGRISLSGLSFESKHPALLPCQHPLTDLIIRHFHLKHLHPGHQALQYLICQQFWILSSRRAIHRVLSKCNTCFRSNPKPVQPFMGNLPSSRLHQVKPFQCVGVDFGGPFLITMTRSRGTKYTKAYVCLFICFAVKAIHLELVSDLSSEAFLAALRRFIARRGRCNRIFSDGGTNFRGAYTLLRTLFRNATEAENIDWSFNPPSAPHFGGLWEAGIKSVKTHLMRVIGEQKLTYEELYTVLTQIEAVLNSRPLCPLSSDPNDLSALTPGHFLTLAPLTALPDDDLSHLQINRLSRWQLLSRLHADFWKRWHTEYLHTLQQRQKWDKHSDSTLKPGMLVLINDGPISPLRWRLARIEKLHLGSDGIARVATIRTSQSVMQRPIVKLCPLPQQ